MTNKQLKEMMRDISPRYQQKADARAASAEHTKHRSWMPALVSGAAVCCAGLAAVIFLPKLHQSPLTANESMAEIEEITESTASSDNLYGSSIEFDDHLRTAFMRIMTPAYAPCAYTPTEEEQTAISTALMNKECVRADDSTEIPDGERIILYAYDENEPERLVLTVFPNDLVRVSTDGYADHGAIYQFPQEAVKAIRSAAQHDGDDLVNRLTWCREDTIGTPEIWKNFVINPKECDMSTQEGIFYKMFNSFDYFSRVSGTVYVSNYYFEGAEPHCDLRFSDFQTDLNRGSFYEDTKYYTGSDMETLRELNLDQLQFINGSSGMLQDDICYNILDDNLYQKERASNHRIDFPGPVKQTFNHETNIENIDIWPYRRGPFFGSVRESLNCEERVLGFLNNFNDWEITGKDQINGRVCTEITGKLTGSYGKILHVQDFVFYVDEETGILMRYFGYDENGNLTDFVIAENMQFEDDAAPVKQIDLTGMTCVNEDVFAEQIADITTVTQETAAETTATTAAVTAAPVLLPQDDAFMMFRWKDNSAVPDTATQEAFKSKLTPQVTRQMDEHRSYTVQPVENGGLFYTYFCDDNITHSMWISEAHSYSEFASIQVGDSIAKIKELEPLTSKVEERADHKSFMHELLLTDGLLVIEYMPQEGVKFDWKISRIEFYPDFTEEIEMGYGEFLNFDYTILPEDYPQQ